VVDTNGGLDVRLGSNLEGAIELVVGGGAGVLVGVATLDHLGGVALDVHDARHGVNNLDVLDDNSLVVAGVLAVHASMVRDGKGKLEVANLGRGKPFLGDLVSDFTEDRLEFLAYFLGDGVDDFVGEVFTVVRVSGSGLAERPFAGSLNGFLGTTAKSDLRGLGVIKDEGEDNLFGMVAGRVSRVILEKVGRES